MSKSLLRTDKEIKEIYERHRQTVYRVCFAYMKNSEDAADAVQETFIRLIRKAPAFENTEHEKAWLIRTASNICKDELKHWWRKHDDKDFTLVQITGTLAQQITNPTPDTPVIG